MFQLVLPNKRNLCAHSLVLRLTLSFPRSAVLLLLFFILLFSEDLYSQHPASLQHRKYKYSWTNKQFFIARPLDPEGHRFGCAPKPLVAVHAVSSCSRCLTGDMNRSVQ